jgi:hypothetical protein
MREDQHVPDANFPRSPVRKMVQFNQIISISPPSTSLLTSSSTTSLSFPLLAEKPDASFKFLILLLSLFIALIIGFILSLILVTQFIYIPSSSKSFSILSKENNYLFEHFDLISIDQLDFNIDVCKDFYHFVCRKWLVNHPLSPLEFKRSWLTERSYDIREKFSKILANISDNHVLELENNQTEQVITNTETDIDDTSTRNE